MKITFLTEEWTQSTNGGHSTFIRQLAIVLSSLENVEISILIPNASPEDKNDAEKYNIKVFEPEEFPGHEPVDCLQFPPTGFSTDFIIGHGIKPGCHGQALKNRLGCQWVHMVLRNAEEMAMYQNIKGAISKGQKQHEIEVELCKRADMVITVGSKLNESFNSALHQFKKDHICNIIPGIFDEFFCEQKQYRNSRNFEVLVFGRGNTEDFELKGLHVAAKAVAYLNKHDPSYQYILKVVGAPEGEQEKLAEKLEGHGISRNHLIVRSFYKERGKLAELFLEVDLVLMPSGTEGFGLKALEALSAGVPILITNNSGLAEALNELPNGDSCIVNSEADWAEKIKQAQKRLKTRLKEANILRDEYKKEYCWKNQCAGLVEKLRTLHSGCAEEIQRDFKGERRSAQKRVAERGREKEDGPKAKRRQGAIPEQGPSTSEESEESVNLHGDDQEPPGHASQQPLTSGSGSSQTEWPSDKELQQIANRIASHWEEIGIFLGIANDQIQRIKIRERNAPFQMLVAWKKNIKCVHPYKTLYDALCSEGVDLSNVADEFLLGKGKNTPTATETVRSGYSSLPSEKLLYVLSDDVNVPKDEKTELLTEKYSEFKDNPWLKKEKTELLTEKDFEFIDDPWLENEKTELLTEKDFEFMDDPWLSDKGIQRSIICRGVVTEYGGKWNLREAAAYVTFHEGAVPKPLFFTGSVWPPTSCCPPIGSDELLVSNVVELSHGGPPDIEFSGGNITVSLMHSASDLKGYEVVIKQLMDPNGDEWKDLETRYLMDMPEAGKPEISDWPQFVEASCLLAQCSTFAAIWRLKTFSFSRHTSVAHQLTCVVPDFPDVRVEVPLTSLPVDQDFTFTLKVQEFPSSEVEEGILVGPVLHISSSHSIEHFEPVTIKIPLTLRESKHDFSKFSNEVVRLLYLDPEEKPKSWTDITDELEGQVFLRDGIVEFKVKHFSRFWLVCKLKNLVSQLEDFTRRSFPTPMPQRVHFLACLRETLCHAKYELLLYCFPNIRRADVVQEISRYETPFIGEGKSKEPLCKGDKIVVSLSALTFEHESQKNKEIVLEFLGNDISDNSHVALIVNLVRDSVPVVKFRTCEEIPKVVCEVTFSKPRSTSAVSSPMGVAMVEERPHFSVNFKDGVPDDDVLLQISSHIHEPVVWERVGILLGLSMDQISDINCNASDKAFHMLLDWRSSTSSRRHYQELYNALRDSMVRKNDVAKTFCLK